MALTMGRPSSAPQPVDESLSLSQLKRSPQLRASSVALTMGRPSSAPQPVGAGLSLPQPPRRLNTGLNHLRLRPHPRSSCRPRRRQPQRRNRRAARRQPDPRSPHVPPSRCRPCLGNRHHRFRRMQTEQPRRLQRPPNDTTRSRRRTVVAVIAAVVLLAAGVGTALAVHRSAAPAAPLAAPTSSHTTSAAGAAVPLPTASPCDDANDRDFEPGHAPQSYGQ